MFLVIDLSRNLLRLLAVAADDRELMLALLAVPNREPVALRHGDADFPGVRGDFVIDRHGTLLTALKALRSRPDHAQNEGGLDHTFLVIEFHDA